MGLTKTLPLKTPVAFPLRIPLYNSFELEIYANDVKCSHGSTTGQLDEDAVFYLRARGLSEKSARSLITQAFIAEVVDKVEQKEVRDFIKNKLVELHDWTN